MAEDPFFTAVITSPYPVTGEAEKIVRLLESGVDAVHIRKPLWTEAETETLVRQIPPRLHCRLRLHDHFGLARRFALGGVHLNSRNPVRPAGVSSVTASCHSVDELESATGFDYLTLSPVFNSISKHGYRAAFDIDSLSDRIRGRHIVALGGVTPGSLLLLKQKGFYGAALLGYIWNGDFEASAAELAASIGALRI